MYAASTVDSGCVLLCISLISSADMCYRGVNPTGRLVCACTNVLSFAGSVQLVRLLV